MDGRFDHDEVSAAALGTVHSRFGSSYDIPAPLLSGTDFEVLELIGRGGMGVVYKAEQRRPRRTVALKFMRGGAVSDRALRRFEFEVETLGRLQHPNIAQIFSAAMYQTPDGPQPFFVMEFIEGASLRDYTKHSKPDIRAILKLVAAVCDGVQHAHQRGVIHRDLKPSNILIQSNGVPKIVDFGVAHAVQPDNDPATIATTSGELEALAGTLQYMSPERLSSDARLLNSIDHRVDVYALGVIMYQLLTERLPYTFSSNSILEAAVVIREQTPPSPADINHELKGDVETIIKKALEKDPADRYQSADALASDIRRYLNHEPITARPPSALYKAKKFIRRNRALSVAVAGLILILLAGIATTSWQAFHAKRAETRANERLANMRDHAALVLDELQTAIADIDHSTPLRAALVRTSTEFLDRMERDLPDDPAFLLQIGVAHSRLARLLGDYRGPSLGDAVESEKHHHRSIALLHRAWELDPDSVEIAYELNKAYYALADFHVWQGQRDKAIENYLAAVDVTETMGRRGKFEHAESAITPRRLCCELLDSNGHKREKDKLVHDGLRFAQSVQWPDNPSSTELRLRGEFETQLAYLIAFSQQYDLALEHFDLADTFLEQAAAQGEPPMDALGGIGDSQLKRAATLDRAGRTEQALAVSKNAEETYLRMLELKPEYLLARRMLVMALQTQADAYCRLARYEDAINASRRAVDSTLIIAAHQPGSPAYIHLETLSWQHYLTRLCDALKADGVSRELKEKSLAEAIVAIDRIDALRAEDTTALQQSSGSFAAEFDKARALVAKLSQESVQ